MQDEDSVRDLDEAIRHCTAGLKALQAAASKAGDSELYPTHIHLAAVELAHAIEVSMSVALRHQ